jgi:hypothetical protein
MDESVARQTEYRLGVDDRFIAIGDTNNRGLSARG